MEINVVVIHYIDMYCFYRVSECKDCKMPSSNLAKVFGPTVIGYSVPDPEPLQMINETKYQAMVSYPPSYVITLPCILTQVFGPTLIGCFTQPGTLEYRYRTKFLIWGV